MCPKIIEVHKASPITNDEPVFDTVIQVKSSFPDPPKDIKLMERLNEIYELYRKDAELIADALYNSLPQGTMERLIVILMGKYAEKCGYVGKMPDNDLLKPILPINNE